MLIRDYDELTKAEHDERRLERRAKQGLTKF